MLEGTFGKGFAYYSEHSRTLSITPDSIFKGSKNYHVSDIGYSSSKSTFEKATGITKKEYQRRLNNY